MKVVTPYDGEIPWRNLSRISDEEMKRLMKQVNNVYTFLCRQEDPAFIEAFVALGTRYTGRWDEPEMQKDFVAADKPSRKPRQRKRDAK